MPRRSLESPDTMAKEPRRKGRRKAVPVTELNTEEVWVRYKETGEHRLFQELIERHQQVVRFVAERIHATLPRSVDVDDLASAGNFGLMDAIQKFDLERGIKFKTYCSSRIRGAILDWLRSQDWVPRLVRQRAARMERIEREWLTVHGRQPTWAELARELEVHEKDIPREIKKAVPKAILNVSDRRATSSEDGDRHIDGLTESTEVDPSDQAHRRDLMTALTRTLTPKERRILEMYYLDGLTLREIGIELQLTESRVCQIHSNVIQRLRERLGPLREQFPA